MPVILKTLHLPLDGEGPGFENTRQIFVKCASLLRWLIYLHPGNQERMFPHLDFLIECMGQNLGITCLITGNTATPTFSHLHGEPICFSFC